MAKRRLDSAWFHRSLPRVWFHEWLGLHKDYGVIRVEPTRMRYMLTINVGWFSVQCQHWQTRRPAVLAAVLVACLVAGTMARRVDREVPR